MFDVTQSLPRPISVASQVAIIALALFTGCATNQTLRPMEDTADASGTIVKEGKHGVALRLLTPAFSQKMEELPTFTITIANQGDETLPFGPDAISVFSGGEPVQIFSRNELIARLRDEADREAERYSGQQAEVFLSSGSTNRQIQDNSAAIAKIEAAKRTNSAAGQAKLRNDDQWKEIALTLAPMQVPAGETVDRLLKLHPDQIRLGEPLRIEIELDDETYTFAFSAEAR